MISRRRGALFGLVVVTLTLLSAAGFLWLRYGESLTTLRALLEAPAGVVPTDVTRLDLTIVGEDALHSAYVYEGPGETRGVLLFVPGLTPAGREDQRVTAVVGALAQAGFRTVVPDLPGAKRLRVDGDDVAVVGLMFDRFAREADAQALPMIVIAVSYGQGPALVALADPARARVLDRYVGLGGYYDARSVLTFATTGQIDGENGMRQGVPDRRARWILLKANADLISQPADRAVLHDLADRGLWEEAPGMSDIALAMARLQPDAQALLTFVANVDPERVDDLLTTLDPRLRAGVEGLSPSDHDLSGLAGKLLLVHGDADPVVPVEESFALAAAVSSTQVTVLPGFSHVEPKSLGLAGQIAMVRAVRELLETRALP
jgi:pimeloyl-ACP methyl ester carboxylesterase